MDSAKGMCSFVNIGASIFEFEHASGADSGTDATTYTGRAQDILAFLRVSAYINSHFAVGGAIPAGNTLAAIDGDAKL